MVSRVATVCLVALLVGSLFAAGSVPAGADDASDDWWTFLVHDHDDEVEDDEVEDDEGDDDLESQADDDGEDLRAHADLVCDESDPDRGHGNDCDGEDEDNPGVGPVDLDDDDDGVDIPIVQPTVTPTPTASPTSTPTPTRSPEPTTTTSPAPTTTRTVTPTPSRTESDDSSSARDGGDGGSNKAGSSAEDGGAPEEDATVVRNSSHEIGGFEAVRSISTNRSTVTAGEWVEIIVLVENVNDEPRNMSLDLTLFGEVVAVESVTVPRKATERVRFVQKFDAAGTFHPSVAGVKTTVRVEERPETLAERTLGSPGQVGFEAIATLLALVVGALAARRW